MDRTRSVRPGVSRSARLRLLTVLATVLGLAAVGLTGARALGPPVVTSLSPTHGSGLGWTEVTISGSGFYCGLGTPDPTTEVFFGLAKSTSVTVLSNTQVRATSPAGQGVVDVTVKTTLCGTSAANPAARFTFDPAVEVDTTITEGPATLRAQGFLNDVQDSHMLLDGGPHSIANLQPRHWRVSDPGWDYCPISGTGACPYHDRALLHGGSITVIVSDNWHTSRVDCHQPSSPSPCYGRSNGGDAPWFDGTFAAYRSYVTNLVTTLQGSPSSRRVDYWDIVNEPENVVACPGQQPCYNGGGGNTLLWLQELYHGYKAIKAADPNAKVIGPSVANFAKNPGEDVLDLDTFMDFAENPALYVPGAETTPLYFAGISWHEIDETSSLGINNGLPQHFAAHMAEANRLLNEHPTLKNPPAPNPTPAFVINEYGGGAANYAKPGWSAAWISVLEKQNVGFAGRTCWNGCRTASLDTLYVDNGANPPSPAASYWVHKFYADMSGGAGPATTRVKTTDSESTITGFATRNDTDTSVSVLIGRHHAPPEAKPVIVRVRWPWATTPTCTLEKVSQAAGEESLACNAPAVANGWVTITTPTFLDGEAFQLTVT
jgi:hypothetical protein